MPLKWSDLLGTFKSENRSFSAPRRPLTQSWQMYGSFLLIWYLKIKAARRDTYFKCCPANTNVSSASHALWPLSQCREWLLLMNPRVPCQHFQALGFATSCSNQLFSSLLQFLLHITARLIFESRSHIVLLLKNLLKLPVAYTVEFKLFNLAKVPRLPL